MMTTIILAAGLGSRLHPLTKDVPKCLIPIEGQTILERQLRVLSSIGLLEIVIVVGYRQEAVKMAIQPWVKKLNIQSVVNPIFDRSNTLYSLALAAEAVPEGSVLLLNGDVVFLKKPWPPFLSGSNNKNLIATIYKLCGVEEMKVQLDSGGLVHRLNKEIDPQLANGEAIGINFFTKSSWPVIKTALRVLREQEPGSYFERAIEESILAGQNFSPIRLEPNAAIEIDTLSDLITARELVKSDFYETPPTS